MYPVIRLLLSSLAAYRAPKVAVDAVGEMTFICRPWDLDMFLEMNNGRVLTLYDLGRFDLSIKCGLWQTLRQQGWGLAVAGSTVRYRKRIRLFDRVTMKTQLVGTDERWFYIAQSMWVRGEPTSSVLLRTCVTAKGRSILTDEVREAMGAEDWHPALPEWVAAWDEGDKLRPWPPLP